VKAVVVGNCQSRPVADLLSQLYPPLDDCKPLVAHLASADDAQADYELCDRADFIFTQPIDDSYRAAHLATSRLKSRYGDKLVTWPNVFSSAQTPDLFCASRSDRSPIVGPLDTYHTSGVLRAWRAGSNVGHAITALRNGDYMCLDSFKKILASSRDVLAAREADLDVRIGDVIEEQQLQQRLFFTFNHPTSYLLGLVSQRILERCELGSLGTHSLDSGTAEPLGRITAPMVDAISQQLGFQFDTSESCRGVKLLIDAGTVNTGEQCEYSFERYVETAFSAYDAQLDPAEQVLVTPGRLNADVNDVVQARAA